MNEELRRAQHVVKLKGGGEVVNCNNPIRFRGLKGIVSKWRELKHYPQKRVMLFALDTGEDISVTFGVVCSPCHSSVSYLCGQVRIQLRPYDPQRPLTLQEVKDLILENI